MRTLPLIMVVALFLTGCGTVEVLNATYAVDRNRIGVYNIRAIVTPTKDSVDILDVFAVVEERPSTPYPLTPVSGSPNSFEGPVLTRSCPEVINLQYEVRFERADLFGRRQITIVDPDPGRHRISIVGESPDSCRAGTGVANRLVVNSVVDAVDTTPGDGVCSTGGEVDGVPECTLRAAIMEANATPGQDVIEVPDGTYRLSLQGADSLEEDPSTMATIGDLDVTDGVSIYGDLEASQADQLNVIIDGGDIARVFHIHPLSSSVEERIPYVHLEGLVITNGNAFEGGDDSGFGGGIWNSGAQLRLTRTHVLRNRAWEGGGIYNGRRATLVADRTQIEANCVDLDRRCSVAGIWNLGHLTLSKSAVIGNEASEFGALYNETFSGSPRAVSQILNSTIAFNSGTDGPAMSGVGDITIHSSTIAFNISNDERGPLWIHELKLTNSLIAGNEIMDASDWVSGCNSRIRIGGIGGNVHDTSECGFETLLDNNQFISSDRLSRDLVYDGFTQSLRLSRDYIDQGIEFDIFCRHEDQNGDPRPADGSGDGVARCDPGAVEWQRSP